MATVTHMFPEVQVRMVAPLLIKARLLLSTTLLRNGATDGFTGWVEPSAANQKNPPFPERDRTDSWTRGYLTSPRAFERFWVHGIFPSSAQAGQIEIGDKVPGIIIDSISWTSHRVSSPYSPFLRPSALHLHSGRDRYTPCSGGHSRPIPSFCPLALQFAMRKISERDRDTRRGNGHTYQISPFFLSTLYTVLNQDSKRDWATRCSGDHSRPTPSFLLSVCNSSSGDTETRLRPTKQ